jgi:hypothetical protein
MSAMAGREEIFSMNMDSRIKTPNRNRSGVFYIITEDYFLCRYQFVEP